MSIHLQLAGHEKDLGGGFKVRRLLPDARQRSCGPFIFFDHFGPAAEEPGVNHDVRPHPHIGLATVTYLFEGAMMHRDSLGNEQLIEPGAINWMTSGRGIVHSERRPPHLKDVTYTNHGLQLWTALPLAHEEDEPAFTHTPAAAIPQIALAGARVRVLVGEAFGVTSPVAAFSRTLYLDIELPPGSELTLPPLEAEMAVYPVLGDLAIDGEAAPARVMSVLRPGEAVTLRSSGGSQLVVIGGEPLDAPRHMWWNFVSSRKERIIQASADWEAQRMGQVPGETEFIPLPPTPLTPPEPIS
jgi:redox-sensitive bicupin YhaK (pirin superfamily)